MRVVGYSLSLPLIQPGFNASQGKWKRASRQNVKLRESNHVPHILIIIWVTFDIRTAISNVSIQVNFFLIQSFELSFSWMLHHTAINLILISEIIFNVVCALLIACHPIALTSIYSFNISFIGPLTVNKQFKSHLFTPVFGCLILILVYFFVRWMWNKFQRKWNREEWKSNIEPIVINKVNIQIAVYLFVNISHIELVGKCFN